MLDHYDEFRQYLEQTSGIMLGDNKQYLVTSRLARIMQEHKLDGLGSLVRNLQSFPMSALRQAVMDAMTTNETLWFRDTFPFQALRDRLLPELSKQPIGPKLRIWSAACSTGQEPYSISMVVEEFKRAQLGVLPQPVEIIATDLSRRVLEHAMEGRYDRSAMSRGLSDERLRLYFDYRLDAWTVKPFVRERIQFRQLNLQDSYGALGKFDIVFCRNVLIYFSSTLKENILRRIHQSLRPGGYLVLGASEALACGGELYEMVQCNPGIVYRARK